mgnify:CR=1 FL=1
MTEKRNFGWKPDTPDKRDLKYKLCKAVKLPSIVDLRLKCSPVEDQGDLGSCTANAAAGAFEYLEIKNNVPFFDMSRLFLYYNTRVIEKTVNYDSGAENRNTIKALVKYGCCSEKNWAYVEKKYKTKPSDKCYNEAAKRKIESYYRLSSLQNMKTCLAEGYPFIFGMSVYTSFCSEEIENTGIVDLPKSNEDLEGGHAVLAVGYNDKTQRFIVRNSWGKEWGQKGYFTIPYEYVADTDLCDDFWTIRKGKGI